MSRTLKFNRSHKNGWFSYKITGVPGAIFVDGRMLTDEQKAAMPDTLTVDLDGLKEEGADQTEAQKEREAKRAEREAAKAAKAEAAQAKAAARLEKLQAAAAKAQEKAAAAVAKSAAGSSAGEASA